MVSKVNAAMGENDIGLAEKKKIKSYFRMWETRDFKELKDVFPPSVYYSECYGPEYRGIGQIERWISHMLKSQTVKEWKITRMIRAEGSKTVVVNWVFSAVESSSYSFNGVSIISFDGGGLISSVEEFKSEARKFTPDFAKKP
ncbi:MAG: nuclear transport factor 2 family protein [Bacilli bacterium]|jgi:hypothetical protein|nr:nuclear transport factor 2 family protein [Bacilli bacterium]